MRIFARLRQRFDEWRHPDAAAERARRLRKRLHVLDTDTDDTDARREIRELSPAAHARVEAAIQAGEPVTEIAHRHGLTEGAIRYLANNLRRIGRRRLDAIERPPALRRATAADPTQNIRHDPVREALERLSQDTLERIHEQLDAGATADEIAEREGLRRAVVRHIRALRKHEARRREQ